MTPADQADERPDRRVVGDVDDARFDALTRRWGTALRSRRTLARLLAGGGVAALLGAVGLRNPPDVTDARTRRHSRSLTTQADPRGGGLAGRKAQPSSTRRTGPFGCAFRHT